MQNTKKNLLQCVVATALMLGNIQVSTISEDELTSFTNNQSPASFTPFSGWALTLNSAYACDNNSCEGTTSYPGPPEEGFWDWIFDPDPGGDGDESGNEGGSGGSSGSGDSDNGGNSNPPNLPPSPGSSIEHCHASTLSEYSHCQSRLGYGATFSAAICGAMGPVASPIASGVCFAITGTYIINSLDDCNDIKNNGLRACTSYFRNLGYGGVGGGHSGDTPP